jgi:hypothetical protein
MPQTAETSILHKAGNIRRKILKRSAFQFGSILLAG